MGTCSQDLLGCVYRIRILIRNMSYTLKDRKSVSSAGANGITRSPSQRSSGSYFFPVDSDEECKDEGKNEAEEKRKAYAKMREQNIAKKNEMLRLLGFTPPSTVPKEEEEDIEVEEERPPVRVKRIKRSHPPPDPLHISLRSRTSKNPVQVKEEEEESESEEELLGPIKMEPINDDLGEDHKKFINNLLPYLQMEQKNGDRKYIDLDSFKKSLRQLSLQADTVKKLGEKRTFSMAIHPSESKLLIVAGDGVGNICFWEASCVNSEPQVYRPHKGPVFCTSFCSANPTRLYTTCIDGSVRRCDMNELVFDDVYRSKGRVVRNCHTTWHCQQSSSELLVAHGDGSVAFVDMRSGLEPVQFYKCHDRSVRTVHVHPKENKYFATASGMGTVCIWDARLIRKSNPKPVSNLVHPKGLKSAFFSPGGSLLLTTCNDDKLRVYNTTHITESKPRVVMSATHNNQTGRWLTPFKATWHPQRDDVFVVGCMGYPRVVDVFGIHGLVLCKLNDPLLTTILSCCQFHPTQNVVAGANSSGRVHVFMPPPGE